MKRTEVDKRNEHIYNCHIKLLGAIIEQAIADYQSQYTLHYYYDSAKHYLFHKKGLEEQIKRVGLSLNIEYIRKKATEAR